MYTAKSKAPAVGSSQWVQNEREQATEFVSQETEEYGYSVRNEMDWLNEHMADIFSRKQVDFADVFKTPGKLRGKTPRTARKRDALLPRQPLTDIFTSNVQPMQRSPQKPDPFTKNAHFEIAEDEENNAPRQPFTSHEGSHREAVVYTDSGYHGSTEDEMDAYLPNASNDVSTQETEAPKVPLREDQPSSQIIKDARSDDAVASDDSFVSAEEQGKLDNNTAKPSELMENAATAAIPGNADVKDSEDAGMGPAAQVQQMQPIEAIENAGIGAHDRAADIEMEDAETQHSDVSSPEKPLQRKSSFNFSALPAREPLGAKKSMGQAETHRSSTLGRSFGTRHVDLEPTDTSEHEQEKPAEAREHTKTTTQLLQERIKSLGKTKEPRSSKSIPSNALSGQVAYPQLPESEQESQKSQLTADLELRASLTAPTTAQDDNDWIAPLTAAAAASLQPQVDNVGVITSQSNLTPGRPNMHQKSMSATHIPSPRPELASETRHQKAFSVSHPNFPQLLESTTPSGSPATKKNNEGPLSASKNRLWSALKSAKSIFASSASSSAAAKLEAHKDSSSVKKSFQSDCRDAAVFNMPGGLYSEQQLPQSPSRPVSLISTSPGRNTRSSSDSDKRREKEIKAQQKAADELERARAKERIKAVKQHEQERAKIEDIKAEQTDRDQRNHTDRPLSAGSDRNDMPPPPPPKTGSMALGKLRAPGRLMKPSKEALSAKPAPVSIRVASHSQRLGQGAQSQVSLSKSQHESSAPMPPSKDGLVRAASAQSNRSGPSAPPNARVKALEAAARKKEADAKAAQRKAEQKRELERKRAAKAEEEKRVEEERKAAENQRVQEAKLAAQRKAEKLAIEARKREQERIEQQRREQEKLEQQREQQRQEQEKANQQKRELEAYRQQEEARKAKEAHELAEAIRRERAQQQQTHPRSDVVGTLRQLVKNTVPVHQNPAKPAKRVFNPDDDESVQRPGIQRGPPSFQTNDAKRRRTSEEPNEPNERPSVMAPPKRPSTWRKDTITKVPHGYTHAPPPAQHHNNTLFKSSVTGQHPSQHMANRPGQPMHPSQMIQVSNARIPFAENLNAPPISHAGAHAQLHNGGHESNNSAHANKFKTPARPPPGWSGKSAGNTKPNTPSYPNGDAIDLPDIATDSEDEDSEDEATGGFRAPSWVASPALRQLLTQQQLVDPESVFGPIGDLRLDEVFKNGKNPERLKRFRDRGSSALWVESGDAVTSAEKRKDMEMRERVVRDGGWRYEPGS